MADVGRGWSESHILGFTLRRVILAAARFGRIDPMNLVSIDFGVVGPTPLNARFQVRRWASDFMGKLRGHPEQKGLLCPMGPMRPIRLMSYLAQAYASTRGSAPALRTPVFGSMAMAAFEPNDHAPADCNL
jgi:hypothetical protein